MADTAGLCLALIDYCMADTAGLYPPLIYCYGRDRRPLVTKFLECDALIVESFLDTMALTTVTWTAYVLEVSLGTLPSLAARAALLNWFIQFTIGQRRMLLKWLLHMR